MTISSSDYEKLGQFYLGRGYDPVGKKVQDDLLLYDSRDLVTHGLVVGMTGSGKTGLCLALLEEAALDDIPAIIIDPKGDISNLMLMFPELAAENFRPWINEDDAIKKGVSADEFAAQTAALWQSGLAEWGQQPARIATLRDKVDINIFTPGSKAGIPVSILSSLAVPPGEILDDAELLGERVESTVSSLLSLVGVESDTIQSPEAVLVAAIFQKAWLAGQDVSLESLIRHIQKPAFDKVGVIDLESFMPEKSRQGLALKFNNLLASPGFATWLDGPPLDIAKMLHTPEGKPRISIFSVSHLGDSERMFFVSLLLNQMLGWMRTQKGTTSLRAILYMDEIYGYLPPTANPPSKRPMMTMLKQGRAFGLGCLLATQNPVDIDYKALSNIGTWFLGRLQTERDKLRVLDGLEGAAGSQNANFDRGEIEKMLSGLDKRVFLMNNVHEDQPVLFHVRWVMSYLTGPMTRSQIKLLMDPMREAFGSGPTAKPAAAANPMGMPGLQAPTAAGPRPNVGVGVKEIFVPVAGDPAGACYRPHLLRTGVVHFSSAKAGLDGARPVQVVNTLTSEAIDWENVVVVATAKLGAATEPTAGAGFATLPGFAMNAANYKQVEKDFGEWLYREQRADLWTCPLLKEWSQLEETESDFRTRMTQDARETRDAAVDQLRETAAKKIATLQSRLLTAQGQLAKQQAESSSAMVQAGVSVLGGILGAFFGRKSGMGSLARGSSAIGKGLGAHKQRGDVAIADEKVDVILAEIEARQAELEVEVTELNADYVVGALVLEQESFKPARADVKVQSVALLWLPYDARGEPTW